MPLAQSSGLADLGCFAEFELGYCYRTVLEIPLGVLVGSEASPEDPECGLHYVAVLAGPRFAKDFATASSPPGACSMQ